MPRPEVRDETVFEAIGTRWSIRTDGPLDAGTLGRVHARIEEYDRAWSRFRDDSLVARMARRPGRYRLPDEGPALLDLYASLHARTGGAVTPTVGPSLERLGYDSSYSLTPTGEPLPAPPWEECVQRDGEHLVVHRPVLLDVGAAGKGQLIDLVGDVLSEHGVESWLIDAGGDLKHRGDAPVRVALAVPGRPTHGLGVVELDNWAIAGSGVDRRAWGGGLHHVLDARTGEPTRAVVATWSLASTAMLADGLATALFFTDPDLLEVDHDLTYVVLRADGSARYSLGLPGRLCA